MFHLYGSVKISLLYFILAIILLASCTTVKNYPKNTPFVFSNKIILNGDTSKDEKKRLEIELYNYWDDSLRVNPILQFGIHTIIKSPPVFDTVAISRSILFMNSFLQSQGYYNSVFTPLKPDTNINHDQKRVTVKMDVRIQKSLRIDTVIYSSLTTKEIKSLTISNTKESLLVKNTPYTKALIAGELDRLVALYRKHGFFKFTRDNIYAEVDTTDASLLDLTLDPFELARKVAESALKRKVNPIININIKQKLSVDSNAFTRYYVGKTFFYPEASFEKLPDSLIAEKYAYVYKLNQFVLKQNIPIIKIRPLREHTYIKEGLFYNDENYYKTVNAISQMGTWSQVDVKTIERFDSGKNIIDFHFFLTPANKYSFGYDLEASRNSGSIISGNLLGLSNVFTLRNRNVWKQAIQSSTNIRAGVELGFSDTLLQTFQASISQTYSFPRFLFPFQNTRPKRLDDYKTLISFNGSYTDRRNFFRLRSGVVSYGYEWRRKNHSWLIRLVNVELYSLDTLSGLLKAFETNPFLRTAFNTGYVISHNATYTLTYNDKRNSKISNNVRGSFEIAGPLLVAFQGLKNKVYQYVKIEGEYKRIIQWRKTSLASRFFTGIGYNYNSDPVLGQSLPFFKQFVAGGPYSMRAWGVRQLGLGSSLRSDTSSIFKDRFGDFQLEGNFEYRFSIATIGGVKVNSALFIDAGNVWNLKANAADPKSQFRFNRMFTDLAIAAGTGIRFDFNYFLIRFDFGYKVKDPARLSNNGWMSFRDFEWRNKEFENANESLGKRNNFAIQLGIGLPF